MAKDPAILFYPGDWQGGTITMSRHLKGCYMDLLIAQFNSGPLSLEEIKTVLSTDFAAWGALSKKFKKTENGLFFNERMEAEKILRKKYSESRRKNVSKRYDSTHEDTYVDTTKIHKEDENKDEDVIKNSFEKSEKLFFDLSKSEIQNSIEYLHRVAQKQFKETDLINFFEGFKLQYGNDFYVSRVKVIQHFRNWLKNQNGNINHSAISKANQPKFDRP